MRNILLLLCSVLLFAQCSKDVDEGPANPPNPPNPDPTIGTVVDTAINPNTYPDFAVDIDGDPLSLTDLRFHIWKTFSTAGADVTAFYPGRFFCKDQWGSIETQDYSTPPNVSWDSVMYQQVQVYNLGDTIGFSTNLTLQPFFTDFKYSKIQDVEKKWTRLDNLVGIGRFYIGAKLEGGLAWIEVEVFDYESIMVYSYYFVPTEDSNYIIAGEEM